MLRLVMEINGEVGSSMQTAGILTNILSIGVPNSGASGIFPVGVVLHNQAVEYNVAAFSELSFPARWQGRLSRG